MEMSFTDADISQYIKEFIEVGGLYEVGPAPDLYVFKKGTDTNVKLATDDGTEFPISVYGSTAQDSMIINPFAEGDSTTTKGTWLYGTSNVKIALCLIKLMETCLEVGVSSATKKKTKGKKAAEEKSNPNFAIMKVISKYIPDMDEQTLKEFHQISASPREFFNIHFNPRLGKGEIKCMIFTKSQRAGYKSVRSKSWKVFEGILGGILGSENPEDFSYTPKIISIQYLESFLYIFCKIFRKIEEANKMLEEPMTIGNLDYLESHFNMLQAYREKAYWCVGSAPIVPKAPGVTTPWASTNPAVAPSIAPAAPSVVAGPVVTQVAPQLASTAMPVVAPVSPLGVTQSPATAMMPGFNYTHMVVGGQVAPAVAPVAPMATVAPCVASMAPTATPIGVGNMPAITTSGFPQVIPSAVR